MNLPLFDTTPISITQIQRGAGTTTGRPVDAGDAHHPQRASSDHAVDAECASSRSDADGVRRARGSEIPLLRSDVLRVIQPKPGPWVEIKDAVKTGEEFRLLEIHDGTFVCEWTHDGSRFPAPPTLSKTFISDGLYYGTLVEVKG